MNVGQGKNPGYVDGRRYTRMIRNKTRNSLFFGFPSYTEPTRVIGVIELVID